MNGIILLCLCWSTAVLAQSEYYGTGTGGRRGIRRDLGVGVDLGLTNGGRGLGIDTGIGLTGIGTGLGLMDRGTRGMYGRGGSIMDMDYGRGDYGMGRRAGRFISSGYIGRGRYRRRGGAAVCYRRGEVPSYDRRGNIEWCSYRYNYCEDRLATCRISYGRFGTCCKSRYGPGNNYCRNGSMGFGYCAYSGGRSCYRYGADYHCELRPGRRHGTCCRGHRDDYCRDGQRARGYCNYRTDCPYDGTQYRCERNLMSSAVTRHHGRRSGLCCRTTGYGVIGHGREHGHGHGRAPGY